jgi:hypothetical protein
MISAIALASSVSAKVRHRSRGPIAVVAKVDALKSRRAQFHEAGLRNFLPNR